MMRVLSSLLLLAGAGTGATAQDSDGRIEAPAPPPAPAGGTPAGTPLRAAPIAPPVATPVEGIADDAPPTEPPPPVGMLPAEVNLPVAAAPAVPPLPTGATISTMQSVGRVIEVDRPERVQVYPDDPESAWWEINPHYAFDRAQREQRPLLLLFTGVWNTQAMALSQEVFSTKTFNDYVKENLVICYLSYPRNYTDAPDALRRIKDKFKVKGYPNVLIFNPNGEVERGIRGYRTGRPIDYFNQLTAACRPVLESIESRRASLVASGYRDWSNYLGKLIFARFVERDATRAVFQDASGQRWTVPINDLGPEDQRLVESFPAVAKLPGD